MRAHALADPSSLPRLLCRHPPRVLHLRWPASPVSLPSPLLTRTCTSGSAPSPDRRLPYVGLDSLVPHAPQLGAHRPVSSFVPTYSPTLDSPSRSPSHSLPTTPTPPVRRRTLTLCVLALDRVLELGLTRARSFPPHLAVIKFVTPCFHPNVALPGGDICLDILKEKWSAVYSVQTILVSLQSLLGGMYQNSPL